VFHKPRICNLAVAACFVVATSSVAGRAQDSPGYEGSPGYVGESLFAGSWVGAWESGGGLVGGVELTILGSTPDGKALVAQIRFTNSRGFPFPDTRKVRVRGECLELSFCGLSGWLQGGLCLTDADVLEGRAVFIEPTAQHLVVMRLRRVQGVND
jgi:hypothetical protein